LAGEFREVTEPSTGYQAQYIRVLAKYERQSELFPTYRTYNVTTTLTADGAHAKQFKRANRALRTIRTYLRRVIRDILRKTRARPSWTASSRNAGFQRYIGFFRTTKTQTGHLPAD
jgi:hypothetical protein